MRVYAVSILAVLSGLAATPLRAQGFTLQQVMSAPFNSGLQAAPAGRRFAWITDQEGRRNLWVADLQDGIAKAHALTHYANDDGQEIGDVAWTPDARQIVYVRGGDFEFPGKPLPNPALLSQGVAQEIWIVPIEGSEPRKLAEGRSPVVSPDGRMLAFLSRDQIWTLSLNSMAAKPVQLSHARGRLGSLAWSPDGKFLSFTSGRVDHSFIGIYSFAGQSFHFLDPSTEMDGEPVWSRDSQHVAFVRIPPDTSGVDFKPRRTAEPWSIRIADATTGAGREVWRANAGQGSVFHGVDSEHQLAWTAGDSLVFPWERDGWLHLYSVPVSGGSAALLTPGSFEVEHVVLSPNAHTIVYSSNQDDIDRRHIWQLTPDQPSAAPFQLTHGDGIEVFPAIAADGSVAILRSDARLPIRPATIAGNGELHDLAPQMIPADFPATKLTLPQQVIFSAADGMPIHGQLFLPAPGSQTHPAIVFFHGGSRRQMLLGWHSMRYYSNAYAMNQYLASLGYIVLSVNYRSGIGYGLNFREALNYGAAGASEFNDVQGAGLYLRSRTDVDANHIGVWGGSYGGYLTALALARSSDLFAAGVDLHGVHDWNLELRNWDTDFNPSADPNAARIAWESSPLASIKTWKSPVLLIQGDDDRNVQFANTVRMAAALREQGVEVEEHVFPDEVHDFLLHRSWIASYTLGADFFNRHLKTAPHP